MPEAAITMKNETSTSPLRRYWWILPLVVLAILFAVSIPLSLEAYSGPEPFAQDSREKKLLQDRRLYVKEEWDGKPAKFLRQLRHPSPFVVISHTVSPPCYSFEDCAREMRNLQEQAMLGPFPDIGYNFLIGGDGNIYEGRGWEATNMHTGFVSRCNIGISLFGNFQNDVPTVEQINGTWEIIKLGVKLKKISPDYKLVPMNATTYTLSPGKHVYEIIKEWPHFWEPSNDEIGVCLFDV